MESVFLFTHISPARAVGGHGGAAAQRGAEVKTAPRRKAPTTMAGCAEARGRVRRAARVITGLSVFVENGPARGVGQKFKPLLIPILIHTWKAKNA